MIIPTLTTATLIKKELLDEKLGYFTFKLAKKITFKAGQYLTIRNKDFKRFRAFSIASEACENSHEIELFIRKVGDFTTVLFNSKEGDEFQIMAPSGHFFLEKNNKEKIFMAGGAGISPLMSMIRTEYCELKEKLKGDLFYSVKYQKEIGFKKELKEIEKNSSFKTTITITRESPLNWKGELGHINKEMISKKFENSDLNKKEFYICGPPKFIEGMKQILEELKINSENIKLEEW